MDGVRRIIVGLCGRLLDYRVRLSSAWAMMDF